MPRAVAVAAAVAAAAAVAGAWRAVYRASSAKEGRIERGKGIDEFEKRNTCKGTNKQRVVSVTPRLRLFLLSFFSSISYLVMSFSPSCFSRSLPPSVSLSTPLSASLSVFVCLPACIRCVYY